MRSMKGTLIAGACLVLAGISGGQKGAGGATAGLSVGPGTPASGGVQARVVSSSYDATRGSTTLVVDISGTESWDGLGDSSNTVLDVPIPGHEVSGIGWDVTLMSVGTSWLSGSAISFQGDLIAHIGVDNFPGSCACSSEGIIVLNDLGIPNLTITDGSLPLEFFQDPDDTPDTVDAIYTSGTISIVYEGGAGVPTVSRRGLIVLALLLLLGVLLMGLKSRSRPLAP